MGLLRKVNTERNKDLRHYKSVIVIVKFWVHCQILKTVMTLLNAVTVQVGRQ